jgi:hypothetical protein
MALQAGKRIVPMLLDKTPLPTELSRFNGMPELMQLLMLAGQPGAPAGAEPSSPLTRVPPAPRALPSPPAPARRRSFLMPAIGVAFATVFCGVLFYGHRSPVLTPPSAPASSAGLPSEALGPSFGGWLSVFAVAVLLILGVVLFRRHKGKPKTTDGDAVRTEEDDDPFSVEPSARQSWEENISILDMGAPMGASSDVQTKLLLEIGPLFTRRLFD